MIKPTIILSIVIATKDRYATLFDCITALLKNYDHEEVEIIVRDNSENGRKGEVVKRFAPAMNLVYIHDPIPVSQSENYELAVGLARGEFVSMIGDDDGLARGALKIISWLKFYSLDSAFFGSSTYRWPGVNPRLSPRNHTGWLEINKLSKAVRVDPNCQRASVFASGCTSLENLPRLYYGFVRKSCLDRLKNEAGSYFPGPSPDMANSFALSYIVGSMLLGNLPLFIAGNSKNSGAGLGLLGLHVGEIQGQNFLPKDTKDRWNLKIPFFWSGQTIWCQSAYTAAVALGRHKEFEMTNNYCKFYAIILAVHPRRFAWIFRAFMFYSSGKRNHFILFEAFSIITMAFQIFRLRVLRFSGGRIGCWKYEVESQRVVMGLPSIIEATAQIDCVLTESNIDACLGQGLE